jgi:HEAT repeats
VKRFFLLCLVILPIGCGRPGTDELIEQLHSAEGARRLHAIRALGERGGEAARISPALADCLKDEDAFIRRDTAQALGKLGTGARSALPALVAALADKNPGVRGAAGRALRQIDPEAAIQAGVP